jgi:hypothetical protein
MDIDEKAPYCRIKITTIGGFYMSEGKEKRKKCFIIRTINDLKNTNM